MARIELPDGRWIELRPMYLSDKNAILDYEQEVEGQKVRYIDNVNRYAAILRPGVLATSWGGDITEMPERRLLWLMGEWQTITEDDALPPDSGTSSVTPSRQRASRKAAAR